MSDLIKREDAIKATWHEPSYTDPLNVLTEVRDRINALPTASTWRRVEDELPPDNRFVLVCNDDHRYGVAKYVGDDGLTPWQIAYCLYDVDLWDDEEQGPVRYWMPIEPPKEEET